MKAFIQLTNNRSCLLRAGEIKADYERGHITVSDGGCIQGVFDMGALECVSQANRPSFSTRFTKVVQQPLSVSLL